MPLVAIEALECPIQHEEGQDPQALPQTTEPSGPLESDVENEPFQSQTGNFVLLFELKLTLIEIFILCRSWSSCLPNFRHRCH